MSASKALGPEEIENPLEDYVRIPVSSDCREGTC